MLIILDISSRYVVCSMERMMCFRVSIFHLSVGSFFTPIFICAPRFEIVSFSNTSRTQHTRRRT